MNGAKTGTDHVFFCRNHPFVDGNKRTALACCLVFLQANDLLPESAAPSAALDEWEKLVLESQAHDGAAAQPLAGEEAKTPLGRGHIRMRSQ